MSEVKVIQADRQQAHDYWLSVGLPNAGTLQGSNDDSLLVQAFASHRTAATDELVERLEELCAAERNYRAVHDLKGDGSSECGRAWDLMRRAGDKARTALKNVEGLA